MQIQVTSLEQETATHRIKINRYGNHINDGYTAIRKANGNPSHQHSLLIAMNMMFSQIKYFEGKIIPHLGLQMGTTREKGIVKRDRQDERTRT